MRHMKGLTGSVAGRAAASADARFEFGQLAINVGGGGRNGRGGCGCRVGRRTQTEFGLQLSQFRFGRLFAHGRIEFGDAVLDALLSHLGAANCSLLALRILDCARSKTWVVSSMPPMFSSALFISI
jgi:hypothetical protein